VLSPYTSRGQLACRQEVSGIKLGNSQTDRYRTEPQGTSKRREAMFFLFFFFKKSFFLVLARKKKHEKKRFLSGKTGI